MNVLTDTTNQLVKLDGELLRVRFDRFDATTYPLFLACKRLPEYQIEVDRATLTYELTAPARFAAMLGVENARSQALDLPLASFLKDDQQFIVKTALDTKRFACWSDCGLGKTAIGLEVARHVIHLTGGRVLIVTLKEVVSQWADEAQKFYGDTLPVTIIQTREQMREWCKHGTIDGQPASKLAVVNYEKFNHESPADQVVSEVKYLAGFIADEASRLKAAGGKQKWAVIESSRGVEYKLALTATPAPNEWVEFNDQGRFLEKFRKNELCNVYFRRDEKTHRWTLKQHAREAFFRFMSSWSIYVRDPKKYGWRMNDADVPAPEYIVHDVPMTPAQDTFLRDYLDSLPAASDARGNAELVAKDVNVIAMQKMSQAAKGFVYERDGSATPIASLKPQKIADLIFDEVVGRKAQTLVWTVYDEESAILSKLCSQMPVRAATLTGDTKPNERQKILDAFRHGEIETLISRAAMLGFGMNFQFCKAMIFSGWTFSYEQFYQAIRRAFRFGQTDRLRVHLPMVRSLEGQMYEALLRKGEQDRLAAEEMEKCFAEAVRGRMNGACAA